MSGLRSEKIQHSLTIKQTSFVWQNRLLALRRKWCVQPILLTVILSADIVPPDWLLLSHWACS